jgi:hypothetical protein
MAMFAAAFALRAAAPERMARIMRRLENSLARLLVPAIMPGAKIAAGHARPQWLDADGD